MIENFKFLNRISKNLPSIAGNSFRKFAIDAVRSKNSDRLKKNELHMNVQGIIHLLPPLILMSSIINGTTKVNENYPNKLINSVLAVHGSSHLVLAQRLRKIRKKIENN